MPVTMAGHEGAPLGGPPTAGWAPLARRSGRALGSPLSFVAPTTTDLDPPWALIQQVMDQVDVAMSRFREDSELTRLNRRSPIAMPGVSRRLSRALVLADRATRVTGGRFDPRVVGALESIGYSGVLQAAPELRTVGPGLISGPVLLRDGRHGAISLPVPADLGGIGKGLALRWAADAVTLVGAGRNGPAAGFLIDAGGDIVTDGAPGIGECWRIGIEDPHGGSEPLAVIEVNGRAAVATSSIRRLHWDREGGTAHHLIDPRTGAPGGIGLRAVTVAHADPAWAEVWSKALFLEGSTAIAAQARRRGMAAWWVTETGALEMTAAARLRTIWVAAEAGAPAKG